MTDEEWEKEVKPPEGEVTINGKPYIIVPSKLLVLKTLTVEDIIELKEKIEKINREMIRREIERN